MNPNLARLQPYPFERLRQEFGGLLPLPPTGINLSIGEPKHAPPAFVQDILNRGLADLATYPATQGPIGLRQAIADWIQRRFQVQIDPETEVLPVLGSREALFAIVQLIVSRGEVVVCPNPFYQIYEGATLLAGGEPHFLSLDSSRGFSPDWASVPVDVWRRTRLVFVCSPQNPTGRHTTPAEYEMLLDLAAEHDFVVAADECYSEIFAREPATGLLEIAMAKQGNLNRVVVFNSLSKRSSLPGLRSGFVAGDAAIMRSLLHYRTYHGSAMSNLVARISEAAWGDESHVLQNQQLYREKMELARVLLPNCPIPEGGFFLWLPVPGSDDVAFAKRLVGEAQVLVLPGSYLGRTVAGRNPGAGFVRVALVPGLAECEDGLQRIAKSV